VSDIASLMCNRYRMTAKQAELAARYGIVSPYPEDLTIPPGELFPDKPAYVVREQDGARILDTMSWGFPHKVPGKRIDKATGKPVLLDKKVTNVRNYTSPFWKSALAKPERRCLVPFTAFSEYGRTVVTTASCRCTGSTCRRGRLSASPGSGGRARAVRCSPS
jgi:putative SOS response-associated peptidase YedK